MAKTRSPNYPAINLPAAIEAAKKVYAADHLNKMHRETVAKHLGYGGLNGASISIVSALLKYGLLEGRGDEIRVSRDALPALVDSLGSPDRARAVRQAALAPELFAEIHRQFGERVPSEENLRAHLQKQGFTASAATTAAQAYRDTMELVSRESAGYDEDMGSREQQEPQGSVAPATVPKVLPASVGLRNQQIALGHGPPQPGEQELARFPLPGGRSVRLLLSGAAPTQRVIDKLIRQLELARDDYPADEPEP